MNSMTVSAALALLGAGGGPVWTGTSGEGAGAGAGAERMRLLERLVRSPLCFPESTSEEELARILEETGALPPSQGEPDERFYTDTRVWSGDGQQGGSGLAARARLTYSFVPDGTTWGLSAISSTGPSDLDARLRALFGAEQLDRGRELFRQALASWRRAGGLEYVEVADDGAAMDQSVVRVATRGDIRIGGRPFGTSTFLAYNAFPNQLGLAGVGGGDMCFNTSFFVANYFNRPENNYRYLRNTAAHEHGHGLGMIHSVPCTQTKLMEPFLSTAFDMTTVDERRGAGRSHGDRFSGNHSASTARDLGELAAPAARSVLEANLSTNGAGGPGGTGEDWFRFSLASAQGVVISVTPTGGSYQNAQQYSGCTGTGQTLVDAARAGNLSVELRDATGATVLRTGPGFSAGQTETINAGTLAAGAYTVRVVDIGPNASGSQVVQLYDLSVRVGGAGLPPVAVAGVDKRCRAMDVCWFMGDVNSFAQDGGVLTAASYDWDLDGDGVFETLDTPQPSVRYPFNGVIPVTLRVTDSGGRVATDTIRVTVHGALTTIARLEPSYAVMGRTAPVEIFGSNLRGVTSAGQFSVSGGDVEFVGIPVPDSTGSRVSGLSVRVAANAAFGPRDVTVNTPQGSGTSAGVLLVRNAVPAPGGFGLVSIAGGSALETMTPTLEWTSSSEATSYVVLIDDDASLGSPVYFRTVSGTSAVVPAGVLRYRTMYHWGVTAYNTSGSRASDPAASSFRTPRCAGDASGDGVVDFDDLLAVLRSWGAVYEAGRSGPGDSTADDVVTFDDIADVLGAWGGECP
ncbi:MAG: PKD domain-containing protein [Planctomycetota bacterium]|nr:PKD domain-containing protein [Planctomycetota bacterium]